MGTQLVSSLKCYLILSEKGFTFDWYNVKIASKIELHPDCEASYSLEFLEMSVNVVMFSKANRFE